MLTTQQIFSKIFRDDNGDPASQLMALQQVLNRVFDSDNDALRVAGAIRRLKTGQTVKYKDGDDGDLEKGVSRSYTVLTTGQYSGTSNITVNSKTVALSNECVKDNRTGLMWARYVPQSDIGPGNDGMLYWEDAVNSEDIFEFCDQANGAELGGYSDWRVPNYYELPSLVDLGTYSPCIDTTTLPSTPSTYHWTSSTRPDHPPIAFYVYFTNGIVSYGNKAEFAFYCRLVRG